MEPKKTRTNIFRQIYQMANGVIITANPQGVDAVTVGLTGTIVERFEKFSLIEFTNEFGENEQWYFTHNEYVEL